MNKLKNLVRLNEIKRGERFLVKEICDPAIKSLSTRLGVCEGQQMKCIYCSFGGPIILQKKFQEIALGKSLTKNILVQKIG